MAQTYLLTTGETSALGEGFGAKNKNYEMNDLIMISIERFLSYLTFRFDLYTRYISF